MLGYEFLIPLFAAFALVGFVVYQQRVIQRSRETSERAKKEKEAVLALMDNIGERMTRKIDLDETLEVIAQYVVEATAAESGAIFLLDEGERELQARVVVGLFPPLFEGETGATKTKYTAERIRSRRIKVGEGILGTVVTQTKALLITDAEADPRIPRSASDLVVVHSLVLCPLRVRGKPLGVIVIVNKQGEEVFDARDMQLLQALADQAAITVDLVKLYDVLARQQRLEQELLVAQDFQKLLLPRALPEIEGFDFAAVSHSAMVVGGDFYDFFPIGQDHLGIVIADVSGKGIPGALIMAMVRSILRAEARDTLSPKQTLARVNRGVLADTRESVFVTMTYGILDLSNRRFRFARAGHEPLLISRRGEKPEVQRIIPEGMAVGLMPSEVFDLIEENELQLSDGEELLMYTDGAIEALNGASEEYGRDRLIELFRRKADCRAGELLKAISEDIQEFTRGTPQHDDITLVAVRVRPAAESTAPERPQVATLGRSA